MEFNPQKKIKKLLDRTKMSQQTYVLKLISNQFLEEEGDFYQWSQQANRDEVSELHTYIISIANTIDKQNDFISIHGKEFVRQEKEKLAKDLTEQLYAISQAIQKGEREFKLALDIININKQKKQKSLYRTEQARNVLEAYIQVYKTFPRGKKELEQIAYNSVQGNDKQRTKIMSIVQKYNLQKNILDAKDTTIRKIKEYISSKLNI